MHVLIMFSMIVRKGEQMKNYLYKLLAKTTSIIKPKMGNCISNNIMMKEYLTISTNKMASRKITQSSRGKYA